MKFNVPRRAQAARFFWSRTFAPNASFNRASDALAQAAHDWHQRQRSR